MILKRKDGSSFVATKIIEEGFGEYFVIKSSADGIGVRWYLNCDEAKELIKELERFVYEEEDENQEDAS